MIILINNAALFQNEVQIVDEQKQYSWKKRSHNI